MTGQYRTLDLAGASTATWSVEPFLLFWQDCLCADTDCWASFTGKGNKERISWRFYQFPLSVIWYGHSLNRLCLGIAPMILKQISLENVVTQIAIRYLYFLSLGILPLLLFSIVRTFLDTLGNDALSMYLMLLLPPWMLVLTISWSMEHLVFWDGEQEQVLNLSGLLGLVGHCGFDLVQTPKVAPFQWEALNLRILKGWKVSTAPWASNWWNCFAEVIIFSLVGLLMAKFHHWPLRATNRPWIFLPWCMLSQLVSPVPWRLSYLMNWEQEDQKWSKQYCRLGRLTAFGFAIITLVFYTFRFQPAWGYMARIQSLSNKQLFSWPIVSFSK